MHVMIVACYHPLTLSACMLNFDLVSIPFSTSIPTSFNILVKMLLHLYIIYLSCETHVSFKYNVMHINSMHADRFLEMKIYQL